MYTVYSFIYPFGLFFVFAYFLCINDMYIHIMYIYIYTQIFYPLDNTRDDNGTTQQKKQTVAISIQKHP